MTAFTLCACGTGSSEGEVILSNENGIQIKDLAVVLVVDTYNLQIVFDNSTDTNQEFDLTKLSVQNYDGAFIHKAIVTEF